MSKILVILHFIFMMPSLAFADVGSFDVIKLKINDSIVYLTMFSPGLLKNGDFCYYNYQNDYQGEVKDVVYEALKNPANYNFYKEVHKLNIKNIPDYSFGHENILYILKGKIPMKSISNFERVEILSAENGNSYGYAYSDDLNEKDNEWLTNNKIEKILDFNVDGEYCHLSLYAIEGEVSSQRGDKLKELMERVSVEGWDKLKVELYKLYKQKIIMLGFCSC